MPYKNPEDRKRWLQENQYKGKGSKGRPKKELELDKIKEVNNVVKDILTPVNKNDFTSDSSIEEADPVLKTIEKYAKYLPLVQQFFAGFSESAKAFNQANANNNPTRNSTIQPPEGWTSMSAMEKLKFKYSRPAWYEAGLQYDAYLEGAGQVNTGYVDQTYNDDAYRRRMAQYQEQKQQNEARSLQELQKKYPDPPLLKENPIQKSEPAEPKQEKPEPKAEKVSEIKQENNENNQLVEELQQDNAKYLGLAINYINGLTDDQLLKHVEDVDSLYNKFKLFAPFLPVHVKAMIANTTREEWKEILEQQCKNKFNLLKEKGKVEAILDMFMKFKENL